MICNNILDTQAIYFTASIQCSNANDAIFLQKLNRNKTNIEEILETGTCNLIYDVLNESTFSPPSCLKEDVVSCNVSGEWKVYSSVIETACHAFTWHYTCNYVIYKNIFCYMCNGYDWSESCSLEYFRPSPVFRLFSTLLKFNPTDYIDTEPIKPSFAKCTQSQIFDTVKDVCRNISCRFPKKEEKGQRVDMVDTVTGLKFLLLLDWGRFTKAQNWPIIISNFQIAFTSLKVCFL